MEKNVKISLLLQIYGKLLTKNQYKTLNNYYNEDLSLSEIAELEKTTRAAIRDRLKNGEEKLFKYEETLGIMKKNKKDEKILQYVFSKIDELTDNSSDEKIEKVLTEVKKELQKIS